MMRDSWCKTLHLLVQKSAPIDAILEWHQNTHHVISVGYDGFAVGTDRGMTFNRYTHSTEVTTMKHTSVLLLAAIAAFFIAAPAFAMGGASMGSVRMASQSRISATSGGSTMASSTVMSPATNRVTKASPSAMTTHGSMITTATPPGTKSN